MTIFKGNDIRGIYGTELKDSDAYKITHAFLQFTKSKNINHSVDIAAAIFTL